MSRFLRQLMFAMLVVALVAAGVFLVGAHDPVSSVGSGSAVGLSASRAMSSAVHSTPVLPTASVSASESFSGVEGEAELRRSAGRFVWAFLRYEVGERSSLVRRVLRHNSTVGFARELLTEPVAPGTARRVQTAVVARMRSVLVSARPPVALVSGSARRADGPEEFSFLFVGRAGGWRASGPGE